MQPHVYAAALVTEVIHGRNTRVWKGTNATITWLVSTFAPSWGFVSVQPAHQEDQAFVKGTNLVIKDFLMKRMSGITAASSQLHQRAVSKAG
jgi:hypothetical protein